MEQNGIKTEISVPTCLTTPVNGYAISQSINKATAEPRILSVSQSVSQSAEKSIV